MVLRGEGDAALRVEIERVVDVQTPIQTRGCNEADRR
jgi:hypothetical protein